MTTSMYRYVSTNNRGIRHGVGKCQGDAANIHRHTRHTRIYTQLTEDESVSTASPGCAPEPESMDDVVRFYIDCGKPINLIFCR